MKGIFWSLISIFLCLIPLWIFLGVRALLNPTGFWQNFVLYGAGIYILGAAQIGLILILIFVLISIWIDKKTLKEIKRRSDALNA